MSAPTATTAAGDGGPAYAPHVPRPPFDPELEPVLAGYPAFSPDRLPIMRANSAVLVPNPLVDDGRVVAREHEDGDVRIVSYRPADVDGPLPLLYWIHGGGMITGHRHQERDAHAQWALDLGVVVTSVEYRLAPEHPYPAALEDCYAGLVWAAAHADALGVDASRIVVMGGSAGGNLAAATVIAARDRGGPLPVAQLLMCPMLDDRAATTSQAQYQDAASWGGAANAFGWASYLGGATDVPATAAPARLTDFTGLPPTFLDCGTAELFRDEVVAYASALWAAGVQAELHLWPGGFHGFDGAVPTADVSMACRETRTRWLRRTFARA